MVSDNSQIFWKKKTSTKFLQISFCKNSFVSVFLNIENEKLKQIHFILEKRN